ncbi:MAG: hypothetical protein ACI8R9_001991 [Paraglaciecola sp.]|jgi:hypothetical protein
MQSKLTIYILIGILFASQSFVFAATDCMQHTTTLVSDVWASLTTSDRQQTMASSMNEHRLHQSVDSSASFDDIQPMNMACCDDDCSCPVGACHFLGPISVNYYAPPKFSSDKVFLPLLAFTVPFVPSVKRPPILG